MVIGVGRASPAVVALDAGAQADAPLRQPDRAPARGEGRLGYGSLANPEPAWIEIAALQLAVQL
jgi:hypothetical protein